MDKEKVIDRLFELPGEIELAEENVISADRALRSVKELLQEAEDKLLTSNVIDGKNAEIRSAQLRSFTAQERELVTAAEYTLIRSKNQLSKLYNELRALQSIADLLKGAA